VLAELDRLGQPTSRYLRPGTAPDVVRRRCSDAGLSAPDEVVEWFGVFDGFDQDGFNRSRGERLGVLALFPRGIPHSLDQALARRRKILDLADRWEPVSRGELDNGPVWRPQWLPLVYAEHEQLAAECDGASAAPMWFVRLDVDDFAVARLCPTITDWLHALREAVRAGAYRWSDADGELGPQPDANEWPEVPRCG
jgi:hypothetical protein